MEPRNTGPGAHHPEHNDEVFYVLEGTASILVGGEWVDVGKGFFIRIPAGITHDFENRTDQRMGLLNFFIPGGFEERMPAIVDWFRQNRPGSAISRCWRGPMSRPRLSSMACSRPRCSVPGDRC